MNNIIHRIFDVGVSTKITGEIGEGESNTSVCQVRSSHEKVLHTKVRLVSISICFQ